jgi:hypothetical protein
MKQWCSDCEVLFVRSLGSSTSSSPPIKFTVHLGRLGLILLSNVVANQSMAKLPIEVQMIWSVIITSIGHQSKSRNKMWVLNHLIWLALIDDEDMSLLHLIWSAWPLWSLDQKDEPDGLWYGGQCRGIFLGVYGTPRMLPWHGNKMGFLIVPLRGNYGWNRRVIKNDPFLSTTPSPTFLETWCWRKLRRKHHKWI